LTWPTSPRSSIGFVQNDFLTLWYVWCKACTYLAPTQTPSPNGPKQYSTWPTSPWSSIGASKTICKPMVCSAHTVHLSCTKISTISKWIEMKFHLSLVTLEYHRVCAKQFLTLWHVWRKPCTYLAPTLTPSLNRLKQDSPRATPPRSSTGCIQNNFYACGTFDTKCAPMLHQF
jgi:hypothetical protein